MTTGIEDAREAVEAALAEMRAGFDDAVAAAAVRGYDGYLLATRITRELEAMVTTTARLRAQRTAEVADDEALTLRDLAKRIRVSTTRAKTLRDAASDNDSDSDGEGDSDGDGEDGRPGRVVDARG